MDKSGGNYEEAGKINIHFPDIDNNYVMIVKYYLSENVWVIIADT